MNNIRTNMRIGGLATGFDTDTMVRDLMRAERMKVDKLYQNRTLLQWKQEDYRSMNNLLTTLRNRSFDMRLQSTYRSFTVSSTNDAAVTATASGSASATSYDFTSIGQLATAASAVSGGAQSISVQKQVVRGSSIAIPVTTYTLGGEVPAHANRFQASVNGGAFVDIDLDPGLTFDNSRSGKMTADLVTHLQSKLNAALGVGQVTAHLTEQNTLAFTGASAFSLRAVEGSSMLSRLGINADALNGATSKLEGMDTGLPIIDLVRQGRWSGAGSITWVSNVDASTVLGPDPGHTVLVEGADLYNRLRFDDNPQNMRVTVNGKAYQVMTELADGANVPAGAVYITEAASGVNLQFSPEENLSEGAVVRLVRHDFDIDISNHTQDGVKVTETFRINALSDSFNSIVSRINNSTTLGLQAFYDSYSDKFSLTSKWKGDNNSAGQDIAFDSGPNKFFTDVLKVTSFVDGKNAQFTVNGLATERKDNTFTINGVTFTLKQILAGGEKASVSVSQDKDALFKTIEGFVKLYNETIDQVNKKLTEERHSSYLPLTDEQKQAMSEDDVKKWEEKARSGMLKGDIILEGALSRLRTSFGDAVTGVTNSKFSQLSSLGITTGSYLERGKLLLDANKLRAAIDEAPESIVELFTQAADGAKGQGIAGRLRSTLEDVIKNVSTRAGSATSFSRLDTSTIGEQVKRINQRIDSENMRLTRVEDRYWRKFAALEKAISKMNSQSAWLAQQFAPQG